MFFYEELQDFLTQEIENLWGSRERSGLLAVCFMPPDQQEHGDLTTNVAFHLAKELKMSPFLIAQKLSERLKEHSLVKSAQAVSGFVNLVLKDFVLSDIVKTILNHKERFGWQIQKNPSRINVESVSANPTGPLHAGHTRVAVIGDVLTRLLRVIGHEVVQEYYINDAGNQIQILSKTVFERYRALCLKTSLQLSENAYPGEYLQEIAEKLFDRKKDQLLYDKDALSYIAHFSIDCLMKEICFDLQALGVRHDIFFSEKSLIDDGSVDLVIQKLQDKGYVYQGFLGCPKGAENDEWIKEELLLFRSTAFGDDQDRPLKKKDGSWTYFATDIAYHFCKYGRGFQKLIDVWGADHASHVLRTKAAVDVVTDHQAEMHVILCQIVNFFHQGQPVKMSKRAGTFVTLRDILSYLDKDALRFMMISKKSDTHFDFDFEKAKEHHKDNPVFYVQYAYARCWSVLRMANEMFDPEMFNHQKEELEYNFEDLGGEVAVWIKTMADWPRQVHQAAQSLEPHRLTHFLYKLASVFHMVWQMGKTQATLRFLQPQDLPKTKAFLKIIQAMIYTLESGFEILGISLKKEMGL